MKALLALVVLVVIAAGGWFYMQNIRGATAGAPEVTDFDKLGAEVPDPTMNMKPLDGAMKMEDGTLDEEPAKAAVAPEERTFNVTATNFAYSMKEIRVKRGEKVTINFESTGGLHDWVVDEFNARTKQVRPGTKTSVTFTPDMAGTFEFYCAVGDHRAMGMVGKLIVE